MKLYVYGVVYFAYYSLLRHWFIIYHKIPDYPVHINDFIKMKGLHVYHAMLTMPKSKVLRKLEYTHNSQYLTLNNFKSISREVKKNW